MYKLILKHKLFILAAIVILGLFLRVYSLGDNPPSLNWDEASTGYNAFSILKTGKDEYGNFLPLSIRSFDDYKPALYTYLAVPFVGMLGLSELAVRLPSAILGTLSILFIYFLILEFFQKEKRVEAMALVGALLFAISPWSLQFSRAAYEGNIGLFFLLGALLFFLKSLKKHTYIFLSSIFFVFAMYSYHSFRLVIPLLLVAALILFFKPLWIFKKQVILAFLLFVLLVSPVFISFVSSSGTGSRLSMVTLFGPSPNLDHSINQLEYDRSHNDFIGEVLHNRRIVYFLAVTKGYLDHYNPDFLFLHGDGGRQHHAVDVGMLYLFDLPLLLIGFVYVCRNLHRRTLLLLAFMLIAPLPSAITTGTPHPVRAIAMLPVFIILSAAGIIYLLDAVSRLKYRLLQIRISYAIFGVLFLVTMVNITYYFHQYYVHTPVEYGDFWQYGYKDALKIAKQNENKSDHIVITYKYDQPYIYYLFYNKIDPSWYQKNWNFTGNGQMPRFERRIGKYIFRNINWGPDQLMKNTLFIGSPDEIPQNVSKSEIKFLNGDTAFRITHT